jgi:hypothetical protein
MNKINKIDKERKGVSRRMEERNGVSRRMEERNGVSRRMEERNGVSRRMEERKVVSSRMEERYMKLVQNYVCRRYKSKGKLELRLCTLLTQNRV